MKKFLAAFVFAARGLAYFVASQRNAKVQLAAAALVVGAGAALRLARLEWVAVVLCIALVLAAEALNCALETLADALHPEQHPLVGRAKDVAAGAVLVCALAAAVVGALVFLPHLHH